jgi:hypothetical protein
LIDHRLTCLPAVISVSALLDNGNTYEKPLFCMDKRSSEAPQMTRRTSQLDQLGTGGCMGQPRFLVVIEQDLRHDQQV